MSRRVMLKMKLPVLALLIVFFGCSSPLMEIVEEVVEVVTTPLAVSDKFPADGAENIPITLSAITVTFDKVVDSASVNTTNFYIRDGEGNALTGRTSLETDNQTIVFAPTSRLTVGTDYTVSVENIKDTDGNTMVDSVSWDFTTGIDGDTVLPAINSVYINLDEEWTTSREISVVLDASDNFGVSQMNVSFDNFSTETGWIPYAETFTTEMPSGEGVKNIFVKVKDGSGNISESIGQDSINLDSLAPEILDFTINTGYFDVNDETENLTTNQNTVSLLFHSSDSSGSGRSQYRYRLEGEDWNSWTDFTTDETEELPENISDATHDKQDGETVVFEAQVSDIAGNVSEVYTASIIYELTAPTVVSYFPDLTDNYPANGSKVYVDFSEPMRKSSISVDNLYILQDSTEIYGTAYDYEVITVMEGTEEKEYYRATVSGFDFDQNQEYTVVLATDITIKAAEDSDIEIPIVPTDHAGNLLQSAFSWTFNTSDAEDVDPPEGAIALDPASGTFPSVTATTTNSITTTLTISADDRYNTTYGMKIWGDNDGSLASFEDSASWETFSNSKEWTFSSTNGEKYLYYKFMDSASNETEVPYRLKIELDTEPPVIGAEGIVVNNGEAYTNNAELTVDFSIDASDATSGIKNVTIIVTDADLTTTETVIDWGEEITSMTLTDGDGPKNIDVTITDYTENSVTESFLVTLDMTSPEIVLGIENELVANTATAQPGSFIDTNPIASYLWEQVDGPGLITFSDNAAASPLVSADAEGLYEISVTVVDAAGNSAIGYVPFLWDTIAPGSPAGTAPNVTVEPYSQTPQPEWVWDPVEEASYYKVSFAATPDWDIEDGTGQTGYIYTESDFYIAGEALSEGEHTLTVKAYDLAGNSTAEGSGTVEVDTIYPVVPYDGNYYLVNDAFYIISNAAEILESGSGIESISWQMLEGPDTGSVTFSDAAAGNPQISTNLDGVYLLSLTVSDYAANTTTAEYVLEWDQTPPEAPILSGMEHTPSVNPVWNWTSGGGGNGEFEYKVEKYGRYYEDSGGSYYPLTNPTPSDLIVEVPWTSTTDTIKDANVFDDQYEYTITVRERDAVGNWSAEQSLSTWIDTQYVSEPILSWDGLYLRNADNTSVTWTWLSGAAGVGASDNYRYSFDGFNWTEIGQVHTYSNNFDDGVYTFYLQERKTDDSGWNTEKTAISSFEVDSQAPSAPSLTTTTPTKDSTPTFTWSGDATGAGVYQYYFNGSWSAETTATSYTLPAQADGTYTLLVRERDQAGNWSNNSSQSVTIDTIVPVLSNVLIDFDADYSLDTNLRVTFDYTDNPTLMRYYFNGWTAWQTLDDDNSFSVPSANGSTYKIYVQIQDAAGNLSSLDSDTIIVDNTPPTYSSFSINGGTGTTSSRSVTLNSSVSGADYMRFQNSSGTWSGWYTYSSTLPWTLTGTVNGGAYGARRVNAEYKDTAGNTITGKHDAIFYGDPVIRYSSKGQYSGGIIRTYYKGYDYTSETGMSGTNSYYVYTASSPTGTKTSRGNTTNTSYLQMSGLTEGSLYYTFVRVYNSEIGWSNYSSDKLGFSSIVTVVYDDTDADDTALASRIKSRLTYHFENNYDQVLGTFPNYTVTLLPESLIDNTYTAGETTIYGDPIIITPGTYNWSTYENRMHNIAAGGKGILGMHYQGARYMHYYNYYVSNNQWTDVGSAVPDDLVVGKASNKGTTLNGKTTTYSYLYDYAWYFGYAYSGYGIYYDNYWNNYRYEQIQARIFSNATEKYSLLNSNPSNTNGTRYLIYDNEYPDYYTGVRQGRFMFWGYADVPTYSYFTSYPIFINMVGILHRYY